MIAELEGPPEPHVSSCGCVWIRVNTPEYTGDMIALQCGDHAELARHVDAVSARNRELELLQFERYVQRELDRELDAVLRGRR